MKKNLLLVVCILAASISSFAQFNINQPLDFEICEEFDGGFATFNLDVKTPEVLGNLNPNDYTVSYHVSQTNALIGLNPLPIPYFNSTNPETIFVSVLENATGDIVVTSFNLIVNPVPYYEWSFGLNACDSGAQDGIATFDLTGLEQEFINGSSNLTVTYYENYQDAELGINMIFDPIAYTNSVPFSQDIFVRVDNPITGCFFVNPVPGLILNVAPLDIASDPTPYVGCETDMDGFFEFSLNTKTSEILNGNSSSFYTVSYHETSIDAENGTNPLPNNYTNIAASYQIIYVRISTNSDCFQVVTLELVVDNTCVSASTIQAFVCIDNPNIPLTYDLTSHQAEMLNGQNPSDFTFTYYISQTNALVKQTQ